MQEGWLLPKQRLLLLDGVSSGSPHLLQLPATPCLLSLFLFLTAFLLRMCVFMCVNVWCICEACEHLCTCIDAGGGHQVPSVTLCFIPWRQHLSLTMELCFTARLAISQP